MLYLFIFWEPSGPSGARMRTNTEVHLALPSAKPSLPRGRLRGGPQNIPINRQRFFEKFLSLSFSYTWKKRTRGIRNYGTGPAESWGRLRLLDTAPPSPPHAYVAYEREIPRRSLSKSIREHKNRVKKTRARTHKALMGHTVDLTKMNFYIHRCDYKV